MTKRFLSIFLTLIMVITVCPVMAFAADDIAINDTNFPDATFRNYLRTEIDTSGDGRLSKAEIDAITSINVEDNDYYDEESDIKSLKGIEYFTNLTQLNCEYNKITELDVSNNTLLEVLKCQGNEIASLNISGNGKLKELYCYNNQLNSLNIGSNLLLEVIDCGGNNLTSVDLSRHTALKFFDCYSNSLTALDVTKNTLLEELDCGSNDIHSIDLSKNTALKKFDIYYSDFSGGIDLSNNTELIELNVEYSKTSKLNLSKNTKLQKLYANDNPITELDLSNNTELKYLNISETSLTSLDLSGNTKISSFYGNDINYNAKSLTVDLSALPGNFDISKTSNWAGGTVFGNILTFANDSTEVTYDYKCSDAITMNCKISVALYNTYIGDSYAANSGAGEYCEGQTVTIDAGYRDGYVFTAWETSSDVTFADANSTVTTFTMPAQNISIYANWARAYTVSFNANGGSGSMTEIKIQQDGNYTLPECTFTAPADKPYFIGWAYYPGGDVIAEAEIMVIQNTELCAIWDSRPAQSVVLSGGKVYLGNVGGTELDIGITGSVGADGVVTYTFNNVNYTVLSETGMLILDKDVVIHLPDGTDNTFNAYKYAPKKCCIISAGVIGDDDSVCNLKFTGGGKLKLGNGGASDADGYNYGLYVAGNITVDGGIVTAEVGYSKCDAIGIKAKNITVNSGAISGISRETASNKSAYGIICDDVVVNGGSFTGMADRGGYLVGIYCNTLTLSNGKVSTHVGYTEETEKGYGIIHKAENGVKFLGGEASVIGNKNSFRCEATQSAKAPITTVDGYHKMTVKGGPDVEIYCDDLPDWVGNGSDDVSEFKKMVFNTLVCDHKASTAQPACEQGVTCTVCGASVPGLKHDYTNFYLYDDNEHYYSCRRCRDHKDVEKHIYDDENDMICDACKFDRKHDHNMSQWYVKKEATCSEKGEKYCACLICGYTEYQDISATGLHTGGKATCHSKAVCDVCKQEYGEVLAHSYTVFECDEYAHWGICSICNNASTAKERHTDADGKNTTKDNCVICGCTHEFGDWEVVKEATCSNGEEKQTCKKCGIEITRSIPGTGMHTYGEWYGIKEPTCSQDGEKRRLCSSCNDLEFVKIPATGEHTFGEWTVVKEATETEEGKEERACSVCGTKEEKVIPVKDPSQVLLGDLNGDGKITAADARLVLRISAKLDSPTPEQAKAADFNGDGKVNAADARLVLRKAAKLD